MYKIDKLLSAIFSDTSQTSIIVKYVDEENNERQQVTQILPGNEFYEALMDRTSLDKIEKQSKDENARLVHEYQLYTEWRNNRQNTSYIPPTLEPVFDTGHIDILDIITDSTSSEKLFKLKLVIFETDFIQNCTNRKLKATIRKAKTGLEVIMAASEIYALHNDSK